ncbi:MAG TPA: hypothetical protein DD490_34035 [Acidobacteria bacterium]|nr:hypothetical protein [Acidobacteriota bacterium]
MSAGDTLFRTLAELALVGIFRTDATGSCTYVNDHCCALLGIGREEALGRGWQIALHPDDDLRVREEWAIAARNVEPFRLEYRLRRGDGTVLWVLGQAQAETGPLGEILGFVGSLTDITEQKRMEEALRESEEHTRQIIETALDAVISMDTAGRITGWNPQAEAIFGWSVAEVLGRTLSETIIPPAWRLRHEQGFRRYLATGESHMLNRRLELTALRNDGREIRIELTVSPVSFRGERQFNAFLRDITERERAEKALRDSLQEKETLLREVHHRVKNNLQIISSLLHFQAKKAPDDAALAVFRDGQDRLRAMILVHENLYRSQDLHRIHLGEYVQALAGQLRRSFHGVAERIELRDLVEDIHVPAETALPCGMIVTELVTNAFKYAYPAGAAGIVEVRLVRRERSFLLAVEDHGAGLPKGFDPARATSFGLQLAANLAGQLNATLTRVPTAVGTLLLLAVPWSEDTPVTLGRAPTR